MPPFPLDASRMMLSIVPRIVSVCFRALGVLLSSKPATVPSGSMLAIPEMQIVRLLLGTDRACGKRVGPSGPFGFSRNACPLGDPVIFLRDLNMSKQGMKTLKIDKIDDLIWTMPFSQYKGR